MPRLDQIILTDRTGEQYLVDLWDNGEVEVSWRESEGAGWLPSELLGIKVDVKRDVQ